MGWEPEERHEHYDAEGNLTGYTVVTRDSEFEDADRAELLAYLAYQRGICDCGIHESLKDPSNFFTFEYRTCPICKGLAQEGRKQAEQDGRVAEQLKDAPPATSRPSDGRRMFVRQLSPREVEARRVGPRRERPEPPA